MAREDYAHYIRLLPKINVSVLERLAVCHAWGGEFDLAVREFDQSAELAGPGLTADLAKIDSSIVGQRYDEAHIGQNRLCKFFPT